MLAVAAHYPNSAQADFAILAGAANLLVLRDHGMALPELLAWNELEDSDDDWGVLATPVMAGLWRQLEQRRAQGGDLATLAEAEQLLLRCSVSRYGFEPARIAPLATWTLPERREQLLLRAWQRQPGRIGWNDLIPRGPADRECLLQVASQDPIAGLPAGDWLIELSSTTTRWRGIRAVEVSDLDVITLADRDRVAVAAWRNGESVRNATWWLRQSEPSQASGSLVGSATMLVDPALANGGELFVAAQQQHARVPLRPTRCPAVHVDRWQVHMMVDRPIHKPGETVQGRLVLRETRYEGEGVDAIARGAAAANQELELRAFTGSNEVRLPGRTDAHGIWSFEVAIPEAFERGAARLAVYLPGESEPIYKATPCTVTDFRRPALLLAIDGATELAHGLDTSAALRATWASGAPASGLPVDATVRVWRESQRSLVEHHKLATDAMGLATLQLPLKSLAATFVRIDFRVETATGTEKLRHTIDMRAAEQESEEIAWPRRHGPRLLAPKFAVVGQPCEVRVRGAANDSVLFVTGRGQGARPHAMHLDEHGNGVITVVPTRAEWPALDLVVAGQAPPHQQRLPLLLRAAKQPEIRLPENATPGSEVVCQVATGVPGTAVTVAVVDERVFTIAEDRTGEPNTTLRPSVAAPHWQHAASAETHSPEQLLAALLLHGRLAASDLRGDVGARPGGPSTGGPAAGAAGRVRTDFRATATFQTVVTGADGIASFDLQLPDDLTTWRVSVVGIAADGMGFQQRRHIVTQIPLAAEPVLPRVVRVGDSVEVPIVVDRKTETGTRATVNLSASFVDATADATATIDNGEHKVLVAGGNAASVSVTMRGIAAGKSKLALSANVGDFEDRSLRELPVDDDAVLRPVSAAAMAKGNVTVVTPMGTTGDLEVSVLGGSSAMWTELERHLSIYPYGCVEQTLAKLLPFFAAVRGAKVHGTTPPIASKEFAQRLRAGLRRMRQLQVGRGGAFSFWPGGKIDRNMTVLVLHGLAVMREGGLNPEHFGLGCDLQREPFVGAIHNLTTRSGQAATPAELLEVELVSAGLRMHPTAALARAAVVAAIVAEQPLPPGLVLRAGLALAAAGDTDNAKACLQRVEKRHGNEGPASSLPGENALAVRALQLELQCVLSPNTAPVALANEVLLGGLNGYSTTYAQACALSAAALAMPRHETKDFVVQLRCGEQSRELKLSTDNGFTAQTQIGTTQTCSVTGPSGELLIVRTSSHRREPGSKHAAWRNPLVIERELCRRDANATPKQHRLNLDLIPITDGALVASEVLWLHVRVSAPQTMRYVVVECPLPAGFEPIEDLPWLERFDDRIVWSCSRVGSHPTQFLIPLIPTLVGNMVWPPTTAAPMYANGQDGGTSGTSLTVIAAAITPDRPTRVACFTKRPVTAKPKVIVETARNRVDDAIWRLRRAFDETHDQNHQATLAAALAKAIKACDELRGKDGEPDYVLDELTDTIERLHYEAEDDAVNDPRNAARTATLLALVELQNDYFVQAVDAFERDRTGEYDHHYVATLVEALLLWPTQEARDPMLAKVLELALARNQVPPGVLEDLNGPIEDDHLRSVLMAMLATHTQAHGEDILRLLPREDLRDTAPTILLQAASDDWPRWLIASLLASPLGKTELARALRDPQVLAAQAEVLVATLPSSYWRTAPLATFEALHRQELEQDVEGWSLVDALATSANTTAALQQELVRTNDVDWQAALANALLHRGVRDLGEAAVTAPKGSYVHVWQRALLLPTSDVAGALQLLTEIEGDIGAGPLSTFLRAFTVRAGSTTQLASIFPELQADEVAAVFERLDPAATRSLLSIVPEAIYPLPIARSTADCVAMWDYAVRLDDYEDVLATFCRSEIAVQFAVKRIAEVADEELRESLQYELRSLRELDPETGQPPIDEPWLPLLQSVKHRGVPPTWTASQRHRYDRIRRLRGVR